MQELEAKRLANEIDSNAKAKFLSMSPEMNNGNLCKMSVQLTMRMHGQAVAAYSRKEILQSSAHT